MVVHLCLVVAMSRPTIAEGTYACALETAYRPINDPAIQLEAEERIRDVHAHWVVNVHMQFAPPGESPVYGPQPPPLLTPNTPVTHKIIGGGEVIFILGELLDQESFVRNILGMALAFWRSDLWAHILRGAPLRHFEMELWIFGVLSVRFNLGAPQLPAYPEGFLELMREEFGRGWWAA